MRTQTHISYTVTSFETHLFDPPWRARLARAHVSSPVTTGHDFCKMPAVRFARYLTDAIRARLRRRHDRAASSASSGFVGVRRARVVSLNSPSWTLLRLPGRTRAHCSGVVSTPYHRVSDSITRNRRPPKAYALVIPRRRKTVIARRVNGRIAIYFVLCVVANIVLLAHDRD